MNALVLGATGMVGSEVLKHCLISDQITSILALSRNPTGTTHPKLNEIAQENFLDFSSLQDELKKIDIVYYCLGLYQNKVSKEDF
jgi:uncharacterized protein YbjT (DUF2867 family)